MSRESLLDKSLDEIIGNPTKPHRRPHKVNKPRNKRRDTYIPRIQSHLQNEINEVQGNDPYLLITNLNKELTEMDLKNLFNKIDDLKICRLEIDTQGVSKGIAYIAFIDPSNNIKAIDQFNGRRAAGQVITVREINNKNSLNGRIGAKVNNSKIKRGKVVKEKKTAEELDAELDNYFKEDKQEGDPNPPFPVV